MHLAKASHCPPLEAIWSWVRCSALISFCGSALLVALLPGERRSSSNETGCFYEVGEGNYLCESRSIAAPVSTP